MSKVLINSQGKFLRYGEVSCHSPNKCYGYSWVTSINEASLCRSSNDLNKLNWKSGNPVEEAVSEVDATETRAVTLTRPQ